MLGFNSTHAEQNGGEQIWGSPRHDNHAVGNLEQRPDNASLLNSRGSSGVVDNCVYFDNRVQPSGQVSKLPHDWGEAKFLHADMLSVRSFTISSICFRQQEDPQR